MNDITTKTTEFLNISVNHDGMIIDQNVNLIFAFYININTENETMPGDFNNTSLGMMWKFWTAKN